MLPRKPDDLKNIHILLENARQQANKIIALQNQLLIANQSLEELADENSNMRITENNLKSYVHKLHDDQTSSAFQIAGLQSYVHKLHQDQAENADLRTQISNLKAQNEYLLTKNAAQTQAHSKTKEDQESKIAKLNETLERVRRERDFYRASSSSPSCRPHNLWHRPSSATVVRSPSPEGGSCSPSSNLESISAMVTPSPSSLSPDPRNNESERASPALFTKNITPQSEEVQSITFTR